MTDEIGERRAVISGVGQSRSGGACTATRSTSPSTACLAAIADAGLTRDDIDGLATYPGHGVAARLLRRRRRRGAGRAAAELNWYAGGIERPASSAR